MIKAEPLDHGVNTCIAPAPTGEPLAVWPIGVTAVTAGKLFDLSERQWWRLHSAGRIPLPRRLGRSCRWNLEELRRWAEAGCPPRDRWQEIKEGH